MSDMKFILEKLSISLSECEIHIKRANYALLYIRPLFPLNEGDYERLQEEEERRLNEFEASNNDFSKLENNKIEYFDQFVYRYAKLQDTIAKSLLTQLCDMLSYNTETLSFTDYINIAEKHAIIESAEKWHKLRSVRNSISHEYENEVEYQVSVLNEVYESYNELLKIFDKIKEKVEALINHK